MRYRFTDTSTWTVLSDLMRQGDFSELLNASDYFYGGKSVQIRDPTTGIPFPNNQIPAQMLSQSGLEILNFQRSRLSDVLHQRPLPV